MSKQRLKVAVLGLGHQALEDHIPAVKESLDTELIGVVDIDSAKVEAFVKDNEGVKGFKDFDDLLKEQTPDFIIIALPHHLHYEVTKKAINKGIHVLKEKPFAISLEHAKELRDLSAENGVKLSVTMQRRFNPIYSTFFQFVDKIGDPFFIQSRYSFFTDVPHEGWRGQKKLSGGGCLIDMGYHMIDLLVWYFGLPDEVFADMSHSAKEDIVYDAEDTALVTFRYKQKNILGSLLVSRVIPPKEECLKVYGTRGIIEIERGRIQRFSSDGQLKESLSREGRWLSASKDQIEYFVKVIRGEKENVSGPEFHFKHVAFVEAAYKSVGTRQDINPTDLINEHEK